MIINYKIYMMNTSYTKINAIVIRVVLLFNYLIFLHRGLSVPLGLDDLVLFDRNGIPSTGLISKLRLQEVDLTDFKDLDYYCDAANNQSKIVSIFTTCWGRFQGIKILKSTYREDMLPWIMYQNLAFDKSMRSIPVSVRSNQTVEYYEDGRGGIPELAKQFAPHLLAIPNVFMSKWGYIFDRQKLYNFGGCTNRAWNSPNLEIDLRKFKVTTFTEPVISLAHPYSKAFFHEVIEIYPMLLMIQPLLRHRPRMPILVRNELGFPSHFPLLSAMGIRPSDYNIVVLGKQDTNAVVVAPYIITPISHYCQFISRGILRQMRASFSRNLPYWEKPGNDILIYHRSVNWRLKFEESRGDFAKKNSRPRPAYPNRRSLPQGKEIVQFLQQRYDFHSDGQQQPAVVKRNVRVFNGNETLEETVRLFRRSKYFIGAHGGGMTNIMFMAEGATVIEIRPLEWPVACYMDIANSIGLNYYLIKSLNGDEVLDMQINLQWFLKHLVDLIDSEDNRLLSKRSIKKT